MGLEVSDFPPSSSPSCYWKADVMAGTHTATLCHEAEGPIEDQRSNKISKSGILMIVRGALPALQPI